MNLVLRRLLTAAAMSALGSLLVGTAASAVGTKPAPLPAGALSKAVPASAPAVASASAPPWEPDPDSVGALVFYNAEGDLITGGSIDNSPIAAYVEGTSTVRAGDVRATLYGYLPVDGESPGQWSGEALGSSTLYPNASAPSPLDTTSLPVETGAPGDESVAVLEADFPNTDTSGDGYAGIYQLRLRTSGPEEAPTTTYDSVDILVTDDTWTVVYPSSAASTTTTLKASASTITKGKKLTLTATEKPAVAGSVAFYNGKTKLASVKVSSKGVASYSTTRLSAGTHSLDAVFTPSSSALDKPSTSKVVKVTVKNSTSTTLKASASTTTKGHKLTLTATEKPAVKGTVAFYNGKARLASVKVSAKGVASFATKGLRVGAHSLHAVFTPSDSGLYEPSTSKAIRVTVRS